VDEIRRATNGNYALGHAAFAEQVSAALGQRATPGKSGRPRRVTELESGELFGECSQSWSVPDYFKIINTAL